MMMTGTDIFWKIILFLNLTGLEMSALSEHSD